MALKKRNIADDNYISDTSDGFRITHEQNGKVDAEIYLEEEHQFQAMLDYVREALIADGYEPDGEEHSRRHGAEMAKERFLERLNELVEDCFG